MKNIMILTLSLTGGGAERVAADLADKLSESYNVILVVYDGKSKTYDCNTKTIDLEMTRHKGKLKILWHLKAIKKVKDIKKKYDITHTISFLSEPDLANVLTKKKNSKAIVSVRNKRSGDKSKILYLKNKWVFKHADHIVALSKMVREDLIRYFNINPYKIEYIYNTCNKEEILEKSNEKVMTLEECKIFDSGAPVIINIGRLAQQKGQWHLIRAFSLVRKTIPNAKLIILGQGEKQNYLKKLIKEYKCEESIFLLGHKKNPYPYIKKSNLFVFSSIYEGLGNSLIESMACDVPIISTDCPFGPRELLFPSSDLHTNLSHIEYGEYGILTPRLDGKEYSYKDALSHSEEMLANAIITMLTDNKLYYEYKNKLHKRCEDFTAELIIKKWKSTIEKI